MSTNEAMTAQEIFDTAVRHLRTQGVRCVGKTGACLYRGDEGRRCAVGALIRDDEYREEMEGRDVYNLFASDMLPERLNPHVRLLANLQLVHDHADSKDWERELRSVAGDFVLTMPEVSGER